MPWWRGKNQNGEKKEAEPESEMRCGGRRGKKSNHHSPKEPKDLLAIIKNRFFSC
jgi:hypothetical protein